MLADLNLLTGDFHLDTNFEELLDKILLPAGLRDRHMLNTELIKPSWASQVAVILKVYGLNLNS